MSMRGAENDQALEDQLLEFLEQNKKIVVRPFVVWCNESEGESWSTILQAYHDAGIKMNYEPLWRDGDGRSGIFFQDGEDEKLMKEIKRRLGQPPQNEKLRFSLDWTPYYLTEEYLKKNKMVM
jgi:hypothetical protein